MSELAYERSGPERFLSTFPLLREAVASAGEHPDRRAAGALGAAVAQLWTIRQMSIGVAMALEAGDVPET